MQYKHMTLELLRQRPQLHDQLKKEKKLVAALEAYATELKADHLAWIEMLSQMRPGSDRSQIASEAMEIALKEFEDRLPTAFPPDENEGQFLDAAMLFVHQPRTPRG